MKTYILDGSYYIENDKGEVIFSVSPDMSIDGEQVVIKTQSEVFAGPIDLISFGLIPNNKYPTYNEENDWEGK